MGEDKEIVKGNLEAFDAWVLEHPTVLMNLGSSREFLKALCPLRYNHNFKSHFYENLVALFPQAVSELAKNNKERVHLDKSYFELRSLKLTAAGSEIVQRIIDSFVGQLSPEDSFCLGEDGATIGIYVAYGPSTSVAIDCAPTDWSVALGKRIVSILSEDDSVTVIQNEQGDFIHLVDVPDDKLVGVRVSLRAADKAEKENVIHSVSSAIHKALSV